MSWASVARAIVLGAYELGHELWRERQREKARQRAADAWAGTPAPRIGCPRCSELSYTPGQTVCTRCGSALR